MWVHGRPLGIALLLLCLASAQADANAEDADLDALLTELSSSYWLGNTPTPPRFLATSAATLQRLEKSSDARVAEAARHARAPLGKRALAERYRAAAESQPGKMFGKWGDYLERLAREQARAMAKGEDTAIKEDDQEAFRDMVERIVRSRQDEAVYRTLCAQAEMDEARIVSETLRSLLSRGAGKATDAECVTVDLGFIEDRGWLTVMNPGKETLTRLTLLLSLECAKERRPCCIFVPSLPPGGTLRAQVSVLPLLGGVPALPTVDLRESITASYELWSDQGQTPTRPIKVLEGFESRKRFILCSLTPGSHYLTSVISPLDKRCFELKVTKLRPTGRGHALTVEFSERQSGQKAQLETQIFPRQFARPVTNSAGLSLPGKRVVRPRRSVQQPGSILPYDYTFSLNFARNGRAALHAVWNSDDNSWTVNGPLSSQPRTLYDAGTVEARADEVARARNSDEGRSLSLFRQALGLQSQGDLTGAKKLYRQVIDDFPGTRWAQTARQNLERIESAGR